MEHRKINLETGLMVGVMLIALAAVIFSAWSFFDSDSLPVAGKSIKQYETITAGITADGDVEISLTPLLQDNLLVVASTFNTHSVDLSQFNLQEIISLNYDGRNIPPAKAFSLSGHHGSGEILFKVDGAINSFTITITGIPKLMERKYEWR